MGRPLIYRNKELTWNNQNQLLRINNDIKYQYDVNGIRACKLVKGLETRYITQNNQIICEQNNNGIIIYQYILNKLVGFTYTTSSGTKKYLYIRNIQGDITSIIDSEGNKVCSYIYDGYGNHIVLNQDDNLENDPLSIGHINPFRYRGYYFDEESGLYYLNSRYYDPETGRFISPDVLSILDETKGQINGLNLYMYCNDNPIMYCDPSGNFAILSFLVGLGVNALVGAIVGAFSYTLSEVISYVITGEWSWSWAQFAGNVIGGAIGGMTAMAPIFGTMSVAFITGTLSTGIGMYLQNQWEGTNYSILQIGFTSLINGLVAASAAGLFETIPLKGLNVGKGSYKAIANQINTKLFKGTIKYITYNTFSKMLTYNMIGSLIGTLYSGIMDVIDGNKWLANWFNQRAERSFL